jgi:putative ABC transport system substrate-binding protein
VDIAFFNASISAEIDSAFTVIAHDRADALFIAAEAFFGSRYAQLAALAARDRIPASFSSRESAEAGLLMSYGTSLTDMARQVGAYTGTILSGAKPAELPVQAPTKYELVVNLKTVVPPAPLQSGGGLAGAPWPTLPPRTTGVGATAHGQPLPMRSR